MIKRDIKGLTHDELSEYLKSIGDKPFRATQIFEWIYQKRAKDFATMLNIPASLRKRLQEDFIFYTPAPLEEKGALDETRKFLFQLQDKETIETVLIPATDRVTVCASTQAGCKFGCRFCASGIGGWIRDLATEEIINQILHVHDAAHNHPLSHIVFMGVGEPLDNYENLLKAIRIINNPHGLNIAARRITISTCGLVPKIQKLAQEGLQVELAVSLHGFSNDSRNVLMPVNKKYPFEELIKACRTYSQATKRQITFEYILIKNVTCTNEAAVQLGKVLKGMLCKLNLIPYNKVREFAHEPPSESEATQFKNRLKELGVHATIRRPRGPDVAAACGQLRHTSKQKSSA